MADSVVINMNLRLGIIIISRMSRRSFKVRQSGYGCGTTAYGNRRHPSIGVSAPIPNTPKAR